MDMPTYMLLEQLKHWDCKMNSSLNSHFVLKKGNREKRHMTAWKSVSDISSIFWTFCFISLLLSLYSCYWTILCHMSQTKCYTQNSNYCILFCSIFSPKFLLQASYASSECKIPIRNWNRESWTRHFGPRVSALLIRTSKHGDSFKLSKPFGLWSFEQTIWTVI